MITLLIMTNGRKEYLKETMTTINRLHGDFSRKLIHDDSGDSEYQAWLDGLGYEVAKTNKAGFTNAMISAWDKLKEDGNEWVFHLEDDWLILEDIDLNEMIRVMNDNPHLKQVVLSRESPINRRRADRFIQKTDGKNYWAEHRVNFSCNPCLYRKSLIYEYPWPQVDNSEKYYNRLFKRGDAFAHWGKVDDPPRVKHIGKVRTGFNY